MNMIITLVIFFVAYAFIASEKVNKMLVALLAAAMMLVLHIMPQHIAFEHIDLNVIVLLISMMVLVKVIERTGIFEYIAILSAKRARGNPFRILVALFMLTAVFSAFLDNITTVLLIAPVSILLAGELRISPLPYLIAEIFASNMGGTATLIGDPPNIMIGSAAGLSFMDFIVNLAPLIVIQLVVFAGVFWFIFAKKLHVTNENRARIMDFDEKRMIRNPKLLRRSLIVFGFVIVGFMLHAQLGLEAATIALAGAAALMIAGKIEPEEVLVQVEWSTIFFFVGLFIMVGGLVEVGAIRMVSEKILVWTHGNIRVAAQVIVWFSGIFSAIVDNIPFVATMIPLLKDMGAQLGQQAVMPLWWALSLGACLGGNGTLIGASANVIVAGFAKKAGHPITFVSFLKYGVPLTLLSLLLSWAYVLIRYV